MLDEAFDFGGKSALITGAGSGLGQAMALALADCGADIIGGARRREPLEETKKLIEAKGRMFSYYLCDVTSSQQVNDMVAGAITERGRIDILINNAGGGAASFGRPIVELSDEDWRQGIEHNLSSAFYCSRAIVPHFLEEGGGRIINVTSGWGYRAMRNSYTYPVAKGGVIQLTKALAVSYVRSNIFVTCIAPGLVPYQFAQQQLTAIAERQPIGRVGVTEDIGAAAVFLCSELSNYMTGSTILVDGGAIAGGLTPAGLEPVVEG